MDNVITDNAAVQRQKTVSLFLMENEFLIVVAHSRLHKHLESIHFFIYFFFLFFRKQWVVLIVTSKSS